MTQHNTRLIEKPCFLSVRLTYPNELFIKNMVKRYGVSKSQIIRSLLVSCEMLYHSGHDLCEPSNVEKIIGGFADERS